MTKNELPTTDDKSDATDHVPERLFADFPVLEPILQGIADHGYITATPVQAATIDLAVAGRDMLVRAKTGTGKTAAFGIPLANRVAADPNRSPALILAPVRELAQQIAEECASICKHTDLNIVTLVGGLPLGPQEDALKRGPHIIVATPGRLLDHSQRRNVDLSTVTAVCLDEADEMLSMGFFEDVSKIIDKTAKDRQILMFSATVSAQAERLISRYLKDPEIIKLSSDTDNVDTITHIIYETSPKFHKVRTLLYLLDVENPASAIIFCNTREDTSTVATFLEKQGFNASLLSGELSQAKRSAVMKKVKAGEVQYLVATDVAARGIDISDLSHVINYALPKDAEIYLHRTGRTGRIGKEGIAINLVGGADMSTRKTLQTKHKIPFEVRELPSPEVCAQQRVTRQVAQIQKAMGTLLFEAYLPTVRALKERPDGDILLAAALKGFYNWEQMRHDIRQGNTGERNETQSNYSRRDDRKRSGGRDDRSSKRGGHGSQRKHSSRDRDGHKSSQGRRDHSDSRSRQNDQRKEPDTSRDQDSSFDKNDLDKMLSID